MKINSPSLSGEDAAAAAAPQEPMTYHSGVRLLLAQAMQASSYAMISATARQQDGRLIAMSRIRSSHAYPHPEYEPFGFAESDPVRLAIKPTREGRSAKDNPQTYGKQAAVAFDVTGCVRWLRQKFPRYTASNIEAETGISAASVENWLQYRSQPSVEHFSILVLKFGPSFLRASMKGDADWLVKAEAEAEAAELDEEIRALERRRQDLMRKAGA